MREIQRILAKNRSLLKQMEETIRRIEDAITTHGSGSNDSKN